MLVLTQWKPLEALVCIYDANSEEEFVDLQLGASLKRLSAPGITCQCKGWQG
jgi:hypothetical protein